MKNDIAEETYRSVLTFYYKDVEGYDILGYDKVHLKEALLKEAHLAAEQFVEQFLQAAARRI